MSAPTPLTTLTNLHSVFGIPASDTTEDALLGLYITEASALIADWCGRTFSLNTWTEYYSGNNEPYLVLNDNPVVSVASVYENENLYYGTPSGTDLLTPGSDYALELDGNDGTSRSGTLIRLSGVWLRPYGYKFGLISPVPMPAVGNIQVTYTAGYATVPTAVQTACEMLVARMRQSRKHGALIRSEAVEDYQYSLALPDNADGGVFPPAVKMLLSPYRKIDF